MKTKRTSKRIALAVAAVAIAAMGGMTVACSPRSDKPAETNSPSSEVSPTNKNVRTNVTRAPMPVSPGVGGGGGGGGGNAAGPCGFGPSGGAPCGRGNN